MFAHS